MEQVDETSIHHDADKQRFKGSAAQTRARGVSGYVKFEASY
jgi:hypothetical protein